MINIIVILVLSSRLSLSRTIFSVVRTTDVTTMAAVKLSGVYVGISEGEKAHTMHNMLTEEDSVEGKHVAPKDM